MRRLVQRCVLLLMINDARSDNGAAEYYPTHHELNAHRDIVSPHPPQPPPHPSPPEFVASAFNCTQLGWQWIAGEPVCYHARPTLDRCVLFTHWYSAARRCTEAGVRLCTVNEVSGIQDGANCNLDAYRVWTSRGCYGVRPHPHHINRVVEFQGHMGTTASPTADYVEECVPEESPLAVLCCADAVGSNPGFVIDTLSTLPQSRSLPHGERHADASLSGGSVALLLLVVVTFVAVAFFWLGKWCQQKESAQSLWAQAITSGSGADAAAKTVKAVKRAGGNLRHRQLEEEDEDIQSQGSMELGPASGHTASSARLEGSAAAVAAA